jgi:uncharacterized protein (DUF305 family)
MLAVMYTMVDTWENVVLNLNQFYMTMMMVLPMTIGMLIFMPSMYKNKRLNLMLYIGSAVLFAMFLYFMRAQSFIGEKQFLKSMIPHHAGAILMCERTEFTDPKLSEFCKDIIQAQEHEIELMREMLNEK